MAVFDQNSGLSVRDSQLPFTRGALPPKLEQKYMNPVRFFINYRVVPGFAILCGLLLAAILILMSIDEAKFAPVAIILFCIVGLVCVALLATVPKTRGWEIAEEMKRYPLSPLDAPLEEPWVVKDEGTVLEFSGDGLRVDGTFYWYRHLSPRLATSNRFNRIWLALQFGSEVMNSVFVPLTPEAITAVKQFSIPLENEEALYYLMNNKKKVFEEIYSAGTFDVPDPEE